jgi:hypothetical protein
VKHLDVIVRRDDGSTAWPKIVAFMDAGTGRVFVYPVLLERGEGVRQEHVVEAFLSMVADPAWGFPQGLYLDNGSEFGALAKIDGALQLLENADLTSNTYWDWYFDHVFLLVPVQTFVGQFIATFKEYPVRQKAASGNLDEVMAKLSEGASGGA